MSGHVDARKKWPAKIECLKHSCCVGVPDEHRLEIPDAKWDAYGYMVTDACTFVSVVDLREVLCIFFVYGGPCS